ncbi:MAG TPA: SAV_2336 N-terminal domain-related protein, partial [Streptosporangiaceae bacterium]|nr:SAV_2336 N-terminal domain-related protein [Streptosporangiaceae bacterium]
FSDCVSPRWQSAPAREILADWARAGPVAIAQPLPQRLWAYTSVSPSRVRFRTLAAGAPNAKIGFEPGGQVRHAPGLATPMVAIPVVQLSPPAAAAWSRLVSASGSDFTDGSAVLIEPSARPRGDGPRPAPPADEADLTAGPYVAGELIRRFQLVASPAAMRLAECLAAAPVSIPVMRLIQEAVLGGPDQAAVAEVFLGGLLCVTGPEANGTPGGERYDFVDGVRPQLLTRLPRRQALEVLRAVADSIDARLGRGREFRALVAGAGIVGELQVDADSLPFAIVAEQVLARMGADFAPSVRQLRQLLGASAPQVGQSPAVTGPREPTVPADGRAGSTAIRPDPAEAPGAPAGPGVADPDGTVPAASEAAPRADRGWQAYSEALAAVPVPRRRTSSRSLACPYCYHAFGGSEIVFRCEGTPAPGRSRCQQLPDKVLLRKMQISTPVFPAFQPGTRREAAHCPSCGGLSRSLACPNCHSPLPSGFRSVDSRMIALIGSSDSGKSAFMTVLIHELRRSIGQSLGSSTGAADATTEDRFARNYDGPLYRDSRLLERTRSAQSYIQPLVFRFTMPGRARWRTRDREILLSFVDSAGEDLASMTSLEMLTRYLSAADAVILMVDPLQLDAVRQEIVAPIALPAQPPPLHDPVSSVERVTRILSLVAGADTIDKPVAVVLSKLDAVAGLLGADSPLLAPSPGTSYFSLPDSDRVQAAATEFLERVGADGISAILARWYSRWRYFAVSALGSPPTAGNELSQPAVRPHRIAD